MNRQRNSAIFLEFGLTLFLTLGIFVLDLLTPLGWAVWMLYLIPLMLTLFSPRERDPLYFTALFTVLIILGLVYSRPDGLPVTVAVVNRGLWLAVLWAFAIAVVSRKQIREKLVQAVEGREQAKQQAETAVARHIRAEERLLVSALRLEGIVQSAMDAIITVDEHQRIVLFNQAAERMFGCSADEAMEQPLDRFIPERFRQAHRDHVNAFGRSGVTTRRMGALGTIVGLRANGEEFPIEAAISQVGVGGHKYFTVILRDITERKRAEDALRESEERYRQLIAVSPYAVVVNRGDRVIFANDQALKLFGAATAEEILGKSPFELFHPDCHPVIRERIRQLLEGSPLVPVLEERIVKLDGTPIEVEVSAARFTDKEGPAILVMLRDVSERKRLQEQLRRTERIAELGTLASGMAHEIGTPMNVILGRAEYLLERVTEEPIKKSLQIIVTQVERITRVMNQLLAFARRRPVDRRPVDLRETIQASLEMFQERLARTGIQVEKSFRDDCPKVYADADLMSQVLINLVMNAIHAMPEGGSLRIGLARSNGTVRLTVADTGHGIAQQDLAKIFDPFFTTKETGKGTGLGLTVVKGIMEEHGGSIQVESEPGKGTTFTISLPVSQ